MYRIYSRISREILDILDDYFFQFDLYAGHKKIETNIVISCLFQPFLTFDL